MQLPVGRFISEVSDCVRVGTELSFRTAGLSATRVLAAVLEE